MYYHNDLKAEELINVMDFTTGDIKETKGKISTGCVWSYTTICTNIFRGEAFVLVEHCEGVLFEH